MDEPRVITWEDALRAGISPATLHQRVLSGRWQRPYPRVYVCYAGAVAEEDQLKAALAYAGAGAALSHETAARRHRLTARSDTVRVNVQVTVPAERRVRPQPGLTLHRSRRWPTSDRTVVGGLACTTAQRTVLDLVVRAKTSGAAAALIVDAVGSRCTTSLRIRELALSWDRFPHRADVLDVLTEADGGAHSSLELHHARVCRAHGLPVGTRQRRDTLAGKVVYHDDFLEEYGIVTELDGKGAHSSSLDTFRDHQRDNANTLLRRHVLRFGWDSVLDAPCDVATQRATLLRAQGWLGDLVRCGPACTATCDT